MKRKRSQHMAPNYADGDGMEEQPETSDVSNHVEDFESGSKPKVKTKTELEPEIVLKSPEFEPIVLDTKTITETLVNHVSDNAIVPDVSAVAGPVSPLLEDDDVKSEGMIVASVSSDLMETDVVDIADTPSAIVNHLSDEVVVPNLSDRTEEEVCVQLDVKATLDEVVTESVTSPAVDTTPLQPPVTNSLNSPAVPEVAEPSSPLSLSREEASVELNATSPVIPSEKLNPQSQQQQQPLQSQQHLPEVALKEETIATRSTNEDKAITEPMPSMVKPKCEVEDALNDVKRDDFFTGNLN